MLPPKVCVFLSGFSLSISLKPTTPINGCCSKIVYGAGIDSCRYNLTQVPPTKRAMQCLVLMSFPRLPSSGGAGLLEGTELKNEAYLRSDRLRWLAERVRDASTADTRLLAEIMPVAVASRIKGASPSTTKGNDLSRIRDEEMRCRRLARTKSTASRPSWCPSFSATRCADWAAVNGTALCARRNVGDG